MQAEDYAALRDAWTTTLRELRATALDFEDVPREYDAEETSDALRRYGYWITEEELDNIQHAIASLEAMIGRAHERAHVLARLAG